MHKVKDAFATTMEEAIRRLDPEGRGRKFDNFMLIFLPTAFLCISIIMMIAQ